MRFQSSRVWARMERGRSSRVAHASGALSASHRGSSATFARTEEGKEAHDSIVPRTQCRRTRRPRRGAHPRWPATRATTTKLWEIASSPSFDELPRDDDVAFLSTVTDLIREPTRNDGLAIRWGRQIASGISWKPEPPVSFRNTGVSASWPSPAMFSTSLTVPSAMIFPPRMMRT